ncbi:MAG: DUF2905 domain-containing protein [Acidobacteriota bacterium]
MYFQRTGLLIMIAGTAIALIGFLVWSGSLAWFGHLPGDIRIERDSIRVYVPITSMLIVSVLLSVLLYLLKRFL